MERPATERLNRLRLLCAFVCACALAACSAAPAPTMPSAPTLAALPETPQPSPTVSQTATIPTRVDTPTMPTPGATVILSSTAEQDLVTLRAAARDAQGGFLFYLDAPGRTQNPQVLQVARGQPFDAVVLAGNYGVREHDFALLCIVDYIQMPCRRDASARTSQFHLTPGEETRLRLNLPLEPGAHDLLFLTFFDPANHSTEQVSRQDSRFSFSFYRAQVVAAGADTRPTPGAMERFSVKSDLQAGAGFFTILPDKFKDPAQAPWHAAQSAAGAPLNFYAAYSNPEQVSGTVALLAFVDFEQVPWDASHLTYLAALDAGARADVPAVVTAPQAQGAHELVVVAVDNPFLDLAGQVGADEPRSFFANSSDRVLISVR